MIATVGNSSKEILSNIIELYEIGGVDVDLTYRTGAFYPPGVEPKVKFDLQPQTPDTRAADCSKLPLESLSQRSVVFDPPFLAGGGSTAKMGRRYSSYPTFALLWSFYCLAIGEAYRILKKRGILIVKCQDCSNGGKQHFSHITIFDIAMRLGFTAQDLFIQVSPSAMNRENIVRQRTARKHHCYFWVFKK